MKKRYVFLILVIILGAYCAAMFYANNITVFLYGPGSPEDDLLTRTGQLGDSAGAINALFSALAFFGVLWAIFLQREELRLQRNELELTREELAGQRREFEAQNDTLRRQRFENTFFQLLHLHRENMEAIEHGGEKGREAFESCFYHIHLFYSILDQLLIIVNESDKSFTDAYLRLVDKVGEYEILLHEISYNYFFYGESFLRTIPVKTDEHIVYYRALFLIRRTCQIHNESKYNIDKIDKLDSGISNNLNQLIRHERVTPIVVVAKDYLDGNHTSLGIYFRQLFQIIKLVAKSDLLTENERYDYAKTLRSQLSNYEQVLLYLNGLSNVGRNWNQPEPPNRINETDSWRENMKLIPRFKIVKNIPASFNLFGCAPERYYEDEIQQYKQRGLDFFEWREVDLTVGIRK